MRLLQKGHRRISRVNEHYRQNILKKTDKSPVKALEPCFIAS
jgi:hypothetical protein